MQKAKTVVPPVNLVDVLAKCKERIRDYPVDSVQYHKIKEQIAELENKINGN
jgi:hypothetical protein